MKKYIGILIITSLTTIGGVFANDCNIVMGSGIDDIVNTYGTKYIDILPTTGLKQALINLKAYCCTRPTDCPEKKNIPRILFYKKIKIYRISFIKTSFLRKSVRYFFIDLEPIKLKEFQ